MQAGITLPIEWDLQTSGDVWNNKPSLFKRPEQTET